MMRSGRGAVAVAAVLLQCVGVAAAAAAAGGDRTHVAERAGHGLGAATGDSSDLWPGGRVPYYIETKGAGALPLDDERISGAIKHWEEQTCLRFIDCGKVACGTETRIRFYAGTGCSARLGRPLAFMGYVFYNDVSLHKDCPLWAAIHEIGHAIGLEHEHTRKDHAARVRFDLSQLKSGIGPAGAFGLNGQNSRDLGPYDFHSVMHYRSHAGAKGPNRTVVSSVPSGGRVLSEGDLATVNFLYNKCSSKFEKPLCSVSRRTDVTHAIPFSKGFQVEFTTNFREGANVTVSYAPSSEGALARLEKTVEEGASVRKLGSTELTFTPLREDIGKTFTLAVRFTGDDGSATTCGVKVRVANGVAVCNGKGSAEPGVCSGRGECVGGLVAPCRCRGDFGGPDCAAFKDCPGSVELGFDSGVPNAPVLYTDDKVAHDTGRAAVGGGSLRVSPGGYAALLTTTRWRIRRAAFRVAPHSGTEGTASVAFRSDLNRRLFDVAVAHEGERTCFSVDVRSGQWYVNDRAVAGPAVGGGSSGSGSDGGITFHSVEVRVDWAQQTVDVDVDGELVAAGSKFLNTCTDGIEKVQLFTSPSPSPSSSAGANFDEVALQCVTGPLPKERRTPCTGTRLRKWDECTASPNCCPWGTTCFEKDGVYAQCRASCPQDGRWTCRDLSKMPRTTPAPAPPPPTPAPTLAPPPPAPAPPTLPCTGTVLREWDECSASPYCCATGTRCFEKDKTYAQCRASCSQDGGWTCSDLSLPPRLRLLEKPDVCTGEVVRESEDCTASPWCCAKGTKCLETTAGSSAQCRASCPQDGGWTCRDLSKTPRNVTGMGSFSFFGFKIPSAVSCTCGDGDSSGDVYCQVGDRCSAVPQSSLCPVGGSKCSGQSVTNEERAAVSVVVRMKWGPVGYTRKDFVRDVAKKLQGRVAVLLVKYACPHSVCPEGKCDDPIAAAVGCLGAYE